LQIIYVKNNVKIIADNKIPFIKGLLEPFAEVEYYPGKEITADKVKDADALIIRTRTKCDAYLLSGSNVRYIATATIGFDHIDTAYCGANNIKWVNAPGCNSGSVMQYVASALVQLSNKYKFSFSEKTIGIVGVGNVGSKVARMASLLGMKVLLNDPPRKRKEGKVEFVSLKTIQEKADIITFHVPLNMEGRDKTFHLFNGGFLSNMKEGAIIINSSRGEIISTETLKKGLANNKVKAAVIDVWENEPEIDLELMGLVDIATPHIAGYSADGKANGASMSIQALSRHFNLGLHKWFPENIPPPPNLSFQIDCEKLPMEESLKSCILSTYDILEDDETLRKSPPTFENQREDYPLRREFWAYKPEILNDAKNIARLLNELGFSNQISKRK
jgi:erythronate-4-phosphate dehydrogenase